MLLLNEKVESKYYTTTDKVTTNLSFNPNNIYIQTNIYDFPMCPLYLLISHVNSVERSNEYVIAVKLIYDFHF